MSTTTVLFVSPDAQRSALAALVKQALGGDIRYALDYAEAQKAVRDNDAMVVVLDLSHDEGLAQAFLGVRAVSRDDAKPFLIVIAGGSDSMARHQYYDAGVDVLLHKPLAVADLLDAVQRGQGVVSDRVWQLLGNGAESPSLDYKETLALANNDERAAVAKDVIAMANFGGGSIVIGYRDAGNGTFLPTGIPNGDIASYDVTTVNQALRAFIDPPHPVGVRLVAKGDLVFAILSVPGASQTPLLAARDNAQAKLFQGRLYCRSPAAESAEIRTTAELRTLLERFPTLG